MSTVAPARGERMTEDEAMKVQKFCPLKPGDFVCVRVERDGRRLYGYGRVQTVSIKGVALTYEGATGKTQTIRTDGSMYIWALPADKLEDPYGFMVRIRLHEGKPLTSWDEALDFAQSFAKEPDELMARPE